ncbi:hypothetical protein [Spiroplasma sp. ChiS]|nr:hypothetical protein [Spiroplasma sp. ChiS]
MIAIKMAKENGVNLIEFYFNKLNKKMKKNIIIIFEDKHNQQFYF